MIEQNRQKGLPAPAPIEQKKVVEFSVTTRLLTPIFGGGPVARQKADPVTPIRGASLRGQLRFWWRATRAGGKTLEDLKEEETRLWGGPSQPGVFHLEIDQAKIGPPTEEHFFKMVNGNPKPVDGMENLAYLGFPLQPTSEESQQGIRPRPAMMYGGNFTVTLRLSAVAQPGDREEAEAALWAWLHFGGLGGRTRRGFGAVALEKREELSPALLQSNHIIDEPPPPGVPSLAPCSGAKVHFFGQPDSAMEIWKRLARQFKRFRQGNNLGRNPPHSGNRPGRSRWPEPDVIRHNFLGRYQGAPAHRDRITKAVKAPRGQFGLPIIFHFPQEKEIADVTLKPAEAERYASPLILRPVGEYGKSRAMALLLGNRPNLDTLAGGTTMSQGNDNYALSTYLTEEESTEIRPLAGEVDPLQAFIQFLGNNL